MPMAAPAPVARVVVRTDVTPKVSVAVSADAIAPCGDCGSGRRFASSLLCGLMTQSAQSGSTVFVMSGATGRASICDFIREHVHKCFRR